MGCAVFVPITPVDFFVSEDMFAVVDNDVTFVLFAVVGLFLEGSTISKLKQILSLRFGDGDLLFFADIAAPLSVLSLKDS